MSVAAAWPDDPLPELARRAATRPAVVLDDDPTGTQTLRDVTVLTEWDAETIRRHLDDPVVFLSTNSRSLEEPAAAQLARQATTAVMGAGRAVSLISRSDSTLRGHFVAETWAIADALGAPDARILLAPFFGEGGRLTVDGVHVLERDGVRSPVGETEFARDVTFGFRSSNLREWVAEKYAAAGLVSPPMISLSLPMLRTGGPAAVAAALGGLAGGGVAIADAETERDIEVVALGALRAEEAGLPLIARTAASYVRARAGRPPAALLSAAELAGGPAGLVIAGSHVPTTSRQLAALLGSPAGARITAHELSVEGLLTPDGTALLAVAASLNRTLDAGRIGLVATERIRRDLDLAAGRRISEALVDVVRRVERRPDWIIAKGGITSSDIAAHALGMRASRVAGQLLPGVPVWVGGDESRWPGLPLVIFPGNVGTPTALVDAVRILEAPAPRGT